MFEAQFVDPIIGKLKDGIKSMQDTVNDPNLFPRPNVVTLNKCSAVTTYGVAAVDAGQQVLGGLLQDLGIVVLRVASSDDKIPEREIFLWVDPHLKKPDREAVILQQLEAIQNDKDLGVGDLLAAAGWASFDQIMPASCVTSALTLVNFARDIVEWGTIYLIAKRLKAAFEPFADLKPLLLRDGILRFGHLGEKHAGGLEKAFQGLGVPVIGVAKSSELLRNKLVRLWLLKYGVV
jgi:hypothetical protein